MPYQIREEEKERWSKEVWVTKSRGEQKVSEMPISYVKNIIKMTWKRPQIYFDTYVDNSPLWLALNRRAGTDPMHRPEEQVGNTKLNNVSLQESNAPVNNSNANKDILLQLLADEVAGIDSGDITLKEARDFIAGLQIKLQQIL